MLILEIRGSIPQTTEEAASLARFALPWNMHFDLVAFCYRNQEVLFDHEAGVFICR